jgi:DNA-binding CsgD family transcriptional regulator
MKFLVIECCGFTRLGIYSFLLENEGNQIIACENISLAMQEIQSFQPNIIFINATSYCQHSEFSSELKEFIECVCNVKMYCYLDVQYPVTDTPTSITRNVYILNKKLVTRLLKDMVLHSELYMTNETSYSNSSIFSDQEILVMNYWMSEMPNYRIARILKISGRTVYVHKRHLTQKVKVRNRLEFCFVYNFIKYLFWPIDQRSRPPLSRQEKEEILALHR